VKTRLAIAPLALLAGLLLAPPSALADDASFLYDPGTVSAIEMTLPQEGIEGLENEPFEYQKGGTVVVRKTSDGTPTGLEAPSKTFSNVEIKLKGQVQGSFQDLHGKAAFKLKFKKAEPFFGLRKLTLNNMTQDPSMVHESLAYSAFAAAGVPASRAGYAYVWLNGVNYGLHLDVESLDTVSLPKIFAVPEFNSATQHLYEAAEYGADFYPGKESRFEVDEGEEDESDLTALIAAVDAAAPSGSIPPSLAAMVDLPEMTRMWAVEKYIGHWDGYAGVGIPWEPGFNEHRPNNYYLYTDASGRFSMLPWGTDQTWEATDNGGLPIEFDGQDGRLFDLCLEDESCAGLFSSAVENALEKIGGLGLAARAEATAAMLAPWQALEAPPRKPYDSSQIADGVDRTVDFIEGRPAEAEAWLAEHPPPAPPEPPVEPTPEGEGSGGGGGGEAAQTEPPGTAVPAGAPPAPVPHPRARFHGDVSQDGRLLSVRTSLSDAGWFRLDGELETAAPTGPTVCSGWRRLRSAGSHWVSCRITRSAWRKLRTESLILVLQGTFEGRSGGRSEPIRIVEIPRRDARR
jgi:CotH protein